MPTYELGPFIYYFCLLQASAAAQSPEETHDISTYTSPTMSNASLASSPDSRYNSTGSYSGQYTTSPQTPQSPEPDKDVKPLISGDNLLQGTAKFAEIEQAVGTTLLDRSLGQTFNLSLEDLGTTFESSVLDVNSPMKMSSAVKTESTDHDQLAVKLEDSFPELSHIELQGSDTISIASQMNKESRNGAEVRISLDGANSQVNGKLSALSEGIESMTHENATRSSAQASLAANDVSSPCSLSSTNHAVQDHENISSLNINLFDLRPTCNIKQETASPVKASNDQTTPSQSRNKENLHQLSPSSPSPRALQTNDPYPNVHGHGSQNPKELLDLSDIFLAEPHSVPSSNPSSPTPEQGKII